MRILLTIIILLLSVISVSATTITTIPATGITTDSVTLNATYSGLPAGGVNVWFEVGARNDFYFYKTPSVLISTAGAQTYTLTGYPLIAGHTYYYRGMSADATGNQSSFVLPAIGQITGYNFDTHYEELRDAKLNISKTTAVLPKPYEDIIGTAFWGIMFGSIFIVGWIRQEDVTNMSLLGIVIAAGILTLVSPIYQNVGQGLLVVSIAGMVYSVIFKR